VLQNGRRVLLLLRRILSKLLLRDPEPLGLVFGICLCSQAGQVLLCTAQHV
jgi:hypothetical protein